MTTQIITTDDLKEFRSELLNDIKKLLKINSDIGNRKYLKSPDLMKILNVSHSTLQTLRINGTLPYIKIGGIIYFDSEEVTRVMKENSIHNKP